MDERTSVTSTTTYEMSGIARPTSHVRVPLQILHGVGSCIPLSTALEDAQAIEQLSEALEESYKKSLSPDGTVDRMVQAAHIIKILRGTA